MLLPKSWIICFVVGLILGALIAFPSGRASVSIPECPECPKCPEIAMQTRTEHDSTVQAPTVQVVGNPIAVTVSRRSVRAYRAATPADNVPLPAVVPVATEPVQWDIPLEMPDSAIIITRLRSMLLPGTVPEDLTVSGEYTSSPRVRIIERTQTATMPYPECPSGHRWGWTIGPYAGVGYGLRGPEVSAGLAVVWGVRVGKLTK